MNEQTKKRLILIFIAALFFVPLLISVILFHQGWRPGGQINHGVLITPAQPLNQFSSLTLERLDQQPFQLSQLNGKWILLAVATGDCLDSCQKNLYKMRQVRIALNQYMNRVQRVLFVRDPAKLTRSDTLQKEYEGMLFLTGNELPKILQFLQDKTTSEEHKIYIIDPLGNLMMYYPSQADPSKMLKDLKRIIHLSSAG